MPDDHGVLSWLHIGDLHITRETEPNYLDLKRIVELVRSLPDGSVDFAVLPGDNADDGTPEQFRLVLDAVVKLPMPLHILPGDHDFKPRALDAFHDVLGAERGAPSDDGSACVRSGQPDHWLSRPFHLLGHRHSHARRDKRDGLG